MRQGAGRGVESLEELEKARKGKTKRSNLGKCSNRVQRKADVQPQQNTTRSHPKAILAINGNQ